MTTHPSAPAYTVAPRLGFGASMPPFCEATFNNAFRRKLDRLPMPADALLTK